MELSHRPQPDSPDCRAYRAIEQVLLQHPGVRQAAVDRAHDQKLTAWIAADEAYLDESLGRRAAEDAALRKWRKTYDLIQFSKNASSGPAGFRTVGWDSSYTRQPIPAEEMREWVDTTVESIARLGARSICEIGCGTGMLLMRIAPHCERYVATDFSGEVLKSVRVQLQNEAAPTEHVELFERSADNFDRLAADSFDAVVINSVVQYFPDAAYLTRVLEGAARIVRPGGHVFVGDVRSLPLLPMFAASVEMFQAAGELSVRELWERTDRRIARDPELTLSPAYFLSLRSRLGKIAAVEIEPRPGRFDNEMTRFRFNAILHVGQNGRESLPVVFEDWGERACTAAEIRSWLRGGTGPLAAQRIPNARLAADGTALDWLRRAAGTCKISELRTEAKRSPGAGIHPDDLATIGRELGFRVRLSWAAARPDGSYDALFTPITPDNGSPLSVPWPEPERAAFLRLANTSLHRPLQIELISRLRAHCSLHLTRDCSPDEFVQVDSLPMDADGTIDYSALRENPNAAVGEFQHSL